MGLRTQRKTGLTDSCVGLAAQVGAEQVSRARVIFHTRTTQRDPSIYHGLNCEPCGPVPISCLPGGQKVHPARAVHILSDYVYFLCAHYFWALRTTRCGLVNRFVHAEKTSTPSYTNRPRAEQASGLPRL